MAHSRLRFPSPSCTAQHSTAQHSTAQHSTALYCILAHSSVQHSTARTAQHSTAQYSTAQHSTALSSTALLNDNTARHCTTLNCTTISQHCTVFHGTAQHYTAQHCTALHCTAQHSTALLSSPAWHARPKCPFWSPNHRASAGVVVVHPLSCPAAQCPWRGLRASYSTPPWCLRSSSFAAWNFCDPHGPSTGLAPLFSPYYCLRGSCVCLTTRVGASTQSTSLESSSE